jgi:MarR family transcriptional regulator, lower aerobic nicotinate degradation pathway regulator
LATQTSPTTSPRALVHSSPRDELVQLSFLVHNALARCAAQHSLSIVQSRLLGILRDRDVPMAVLARHLELDKASVSGLVDRAERRDLVTRVPSADDRRSVLVHLTTTGREMISNVGLAFEEDVERLVAPLSPAESTSLSNMIQRVVASFNDNSD